MGGVMTKGKKDDEGENGENVEEMEGAEEPEAQGEDAEPDAEQVEEEPLDETLENVEESPSKGRKSGRKGKGKGKGKGGMSKGRGKGGKSQDGKIGKGGKIGATRRSFVAAPGGGMSPSLKPRLPSSAKSKRGGGMTHTKRVVRKSRRGPMQPAQDSTQPLQAGFEVQPQTTPPSPHAKPQGTMGPTRRVISGIQPQDTMGPTRRAVSGIQPQNTMGPTRRVVSGIQPQVGGKGVGRTRRAFSSAEQPAGECGAVVPQVPLQNAAAGGKGPAPTPIGGKGVAGPSFVRRDKGGKGRKGVRPFQARTAGKGHVAQAAPPAMVPPPDKAQEDTDANRLSRASTSASDAVAA